MNPNLTAVGQLRALAKSQKRPVRTVNMFDCDVCTGVLDLREALENTPPPPDRLRYEVRVQVAERSFAIRANESYLAIEVRGNFSAGLFSINRPSMLVTFFHGEMTRRLTIGEHPVFGIGGDLALPALQDTVVQEAILALRLAPDECLRAYGNGISVYVRPRPGRPLAEILNILVKLADGLPPDDTRPPSLADLPDQFRPLVPMIRKWAMSDDADRTERLERASRRQLQALVRRVSPLFDAINLYLDGFPDALPVAASALGTLAEAAAEAKLILEGPASRQTGA